MGEVITKQKDNPESKICVRCIYDTNITNIEFDEEGICNYCRQVEDLAKLYGTGQDKGKMSGCGSSMRLKKMEKARNMIVLWA